MPLSEEEKAKKAEEKRIADEQKAADEKAEKEKKAAELEERQIQEQQKKKAAEESKKTQVVLKGVFGDDINEADYFYSKEGKGKAPAYFNKSCGYPVDREEMLVIFNRIFKPEHGFLFYKARDKEVYVIIVPLKYAHTIGDQHESLEGDFQKHAISFINEGSVNLDSLKMKLERVSSTIKRTD